MTNAQDDVTPSQAAAEDAAIRDLVATAERHQNDVDPFIALHTAEAVIVNIAGRRVLGREKIRAAMASALESPLAQVLTHVEVEDIRFVRPDVAIVSSIKHVSDERDVQPDDGNQGQLPSAGSLTYVVVKEHDAWRIAVAHTTPIA